MPDALILKTEATEATVNVLHVLVKIVDHLRADPVYSDQERELGLQNAESLIKIIKVKTGNQRIVGRQ